MPKLHIICVRPGGMNRGGKRHRGHGVHELSDFAADRLREMFAEPDLVLIIGGEQLTDAQVAKIEAEAATAEKANAKGGAKS